MKKPTVLHSLTDIQKKYLKDFSHRFYVIPPGRRSRKTLLGMAKEYYIGGRGAGLNMFMAAPTSQQAKRIFWEKIKTDLQYFIVHENNTEMTITLYNDTKIMVSGLDKPERLEGSPWDYGLITETGNTKKDFWAEHIRPCFSDTARVVNVNDKKNGIDNIQLGACIFDGVPEGRNHYYDFALRACDGLIPQTEPLIGQFKDNDYWVYYHWFSSDVLDIAEIEDARKDMDERTFKQEYEGQFVSYEGTLYYNFSTKNISDEMAYYNSQEPIYLSCDFNKSPLVWEVGQKRNQKACVIDEISISYNAKTQLAAEEFCKRYKKKDANNLVYLTGDASGNIESTKDYTTDYLIIEQVLKQNGFNVRMEVPSFNPSVNNRINLTCSLFQSLTGEVRCFIHSQCKRLIADLNRNIGDGKGGKDKSDPQQTHASDAFDYMIVNMFDSDLWGTQYGQAKV